MNVLSVLPCSSGAKEMQKKKQQRNHQSVRTSATGDLDAVSLLTPHPFTQQAKIHISDLHQNLF